MTFDPAKYGVYETNGIEGFRDLQELDRDRTVALTDPELARVNRLRLVTDPGCPFWDVSYCWGTMKDGESVWVDLGVSQFRRGRGTKPLKAQIVDLCKREGVYAKGLGLLDDATISTLV